MTTSPAPESSAPARIPPGLVFGDLGCWLGFGFGSGLLPRAPGTWGTLAALPLYALLQPLPPALYLAVVAGLFAVGIPICRRCQRRLGIGDHPGIVWDEIVGYLLTLAAVPFSWTALLLGFLLFRLFDVLKPWPIRVVDRNVHGGLGVMLDDALAGLLAALCLWAALSP